MRGAVTKGTPLARTKACSQRQQAYADCACGQMIVKHDRAASQNSHIRRVLMRRRKAFEAGQLCPRPLLPRNLSTHLAANH